MSYIGKTPTPAPLTSSDIEDGIITTTKIADANVTNPKLTSGSQQNFRNIIINGDMSIAQRGTSTSSITADGFYSCDRWKLGIGSFGTWTQSQEADGPAGTGLTKSLKMDCTTAQGSPAASSSILLEYSIEGQHLQEICQGTANAKQTTLSFWHKHTKTGINTVELLDADNNNAVSGSYTQSVSDTWEKAVITFPAHTSGAYDNDNARSLRIRFAIAKGTDTTSGTLATTWQTSITNANRHPGQVNNADNTSNNFIITGVQYEVGTTASDFEFLPVDVNLTRCQRYFQTFRGGADIEIASGGMGATTSFVGLVSYLVEMRATPTFTANSGTDYFRVYTTAGSNPVTIAANNLTGTRTMTLNATTPSSLTAGQAGTIRCLSASATVDFSSEL